MDSATEFYNRYNISGKSRRNVDLDAFCYNVVSRFQQTLQYKPSEKVSPRDISSEVQKLAECGMRRAKYVDEASRFLTRHRVTPSSMIVQAWSARADALAAGVPDRASEIMVWAKARGVERLYNNNEEYYNERGLTLEDIKTNYANFVHELSRCYDDNTALESIINYKNSPHPKKLLPHDERSLKHGDGTSYVGTILDVKDPRGMTIGYDTGCCMTVDGASSTCITSGYTDANAGFFALYEKTGKIVAQSYFYVNPEEPEVLVLDNIESNAGRGANKIVDLYDEYYY